MIGTKDLKQTEEDLIQQLSLLNFNSAHGLAQPQQQPQQQLEKTESSLLNCDPFRKYLHYLL